MEFASKFFATKSWMVDSVLFAESLFRLPLLCIGTVKSFSTDSLAGRVDLSPLNISVGMPAPKASATTDDTAFRSSSILPSA